MPRPSTDARVVPLLFLAALATGACDEGHPTRPETDAMRDTVALVWDEAVLQSIRELKHGPPMNARSLALVHTAMYDAWTAYDDIAVGTRLGETLRRPPPERTVANAAEAVSFAAYGVLLTLFPSRAGVFRELVAGLGYDPDDVTLDPSTPAGVGNRAAAALLEARADDGSNWQNGYADYTGYVPVNGPLDPTEPGVGGLVDPSRWQPLVHDVAGEKVVQTWIIPHWEYVTPFAMASGDEFLPPPPAEPGSAEFARQVEEIVELQASLTDEQKVIAEYWADGPSSEFPPGHWHTIAQYVSRRDGHSLEEDVKMFFLVANAVFDAGIAVWTAKIRYDYVRPITAVRYMKAGEEIQAWAGPGLGTRTIEADRWVPYQRADFRTPPFAEYTSGHSGFSMAAATVLRRFTGSDAYGDCATFPPGWTKAEPGLAPTTEVTLCWPTFTAAAEEAGMSRLYGGIHFRTGNEASLTMGAVIGDRVWDVARGYFTGRVRPAPSS